MNGNYEIEPIRKKGVVRMERNHESTRKLKKCRKNNHKLNWRIKASKAA